MLKQFDSPKVHLEQYVTEGDLAATPIWEANNFDWISGKTIVDLGAGTGILGIGCLLMGAKRVVFVEKDPDAVKILEQNIELTTADYEISTDLDIITSDIHKPGIFEEKFDLVLMNPPFGTRDCGADLAFLELAFKLSDRIITFHKTSTEKKIEETAKKHSFIPFRTWKFKFPLKNTMEGHKKKIELIDVTCWLLEKKQ